MPMSPRTLRPRTGGFHPEAESWKTRVVANGGTVTTATVMAVSNFCKSIDSNGLRSLLWRVNPMCGSNLAAALVPLYLSSTKGGATQGNATDTNDNFVSGDYTSTSGLVGNGSNKRLNTGLPVNFTSQRHLGCFVHTANSITFRTYMGARGGNNSGEGLLALSGGNPASSVTWRNWSDAGTNNNVTGTVASGDFQFGTHGSGAGASIFYINGASVGTPATGVNAGAVTQPFYIFALNAAGTINEHINGRLGGYTIGGNMTASQALAYYNAWYALLKALGRK